MLTAVALVALYVIARILGNEKNTTFEKVLYTVATCIVAGFILLSLSPDRSAKTPKTYYTEWEATKNAMREQLKAPSTAKFCDYSDLKYKDEWNKVLLEGWVDAQNDLGVTVRTNFKAECRLGDATILSTW